MIPQPVREVLEARQQLARTSLAKYEALERAVTSGDRVRGSFLFHGADTGRWAGRGFQPQNLPRPIIRQSEIPVARELVKSCDAETWSLLYEDPMGALASMVRSVIALPGDVLSVADLSSIESVMAAWVAGSESRLDLFRAGLDPYKDFASKIYNVPYDSVSKKQRDLMKPCELGRQYGMGAAGLVRYGEAMGIELPHHEAQAQIKTWNQNNQEIMQAWKDVQAACMESIGAPGRVFEACRCQIKTDADFLMIKLPSGRRLHYRKPREVQGNYGPEIGYLQSPKGLIKTFGARLFENIVQAVSRDILKEGMINAAAAGLEIFGHVHDEIMVEGDHLPELIKAMTTPPDWCPDAPIRAEGYVGAFYRKD